MNFTAYNVLMFSSIGFMLLRGVGELLKSVKSAYGIWLLLFAALIYASAFWALSQSLAMNLANTFFKAVVMLLFVYSETNSFDKLILRLKQFMAATLFMMAKILIAFFSGQNRLNSFVKGVGLYFNTVAQILALAIVLALWFIFNRRQHKGMTAWVCCLYVVAAYTMIIWSGSRKSLLIPLVGLFIVVLIGRYDIRARFRWIIFALFVMVVIWHFVMSNVELSGRMDNLFSTLLSDSKSDVSVLERQYYRDTAWKLFLQKPFFGWGANGFMAYLTQIRYAHVAYCHNNWLEIMSSFGIVGAVIYYWFYAYLIVKLYQNRELEWNMGSFFLTIILIFVIFEYGIVTYYFTIYHVLFCFAAIFLKCASKQPAGRLRSGQ